MAPQKMSEGKIIAIYDIVWKVEINSNGETQVHTQYGGERVQFRRRTSPADISSPSRDSSGHEQHPYTAILKYGTYEAIYPCPSTIFRNFDILNLPSGSQFFAALPPISANGSLALRFVDTYDDEGLPFMCFRISRTVGIEERSVIGWAKRREYDDESVDPDNLTSLSFREKEKLARREEIAMLRLEGVEEGELQG
ncbi:uncharacterized protein L3040_006314 [Drepanopeziza brunnea f. sp. 'multigermtubi']|uniref:Uncharacterized protein n=1 Tax=Marssonina brunnea f. sp. multigermtubi (strain MB_m1) TaxID=1072389 RepID=K1X631_MARBU|nr:uncharacterized protein MBM_01274 [Drepanopeziza brunnea f. sp. 'multigermtubi' MB_m1]EKD20592.1 hypothetical protein MBM_01274 [Drepanopeziza brunnea f. sp. 'multigermtubi' MB_m1]KAJ5038633.1 hypothetical protein L3040_006314 [Drepanopeziza brunnea f. sp. 'multigermtubi']